MKNNEVEPLQQMEIDKGDILGPNAITTTQFLTNQTSVTVVECHGFNSVKQYFV